MFCSQLAKLPATCQNSCTLRLSNLPASLHNHTVERRPIRTALQALPSEDGRASPLRVFSPTTAASADLSMSLADYQQGQPESLPNLPSTEQVAIEDVRAPVAAEMDQMAINLKNVVGQRHPMLMSAADQIFGAGGKRLRPMIVFLVGKATCAATGIEQLTSRHLRLAEITEMIHTASLLHDDVLDDCDTRRGAATVNSTYGSRIAILAGDFLFAQSSWGLAQLDNLEVIKLISQVIADFADGEISQAVSLFDTELTLQQYLDKSFYKTASLIAASCKGAAVFSEVDQQLKEQMFDYGKHLGLAFQVVDDILDYTQSAEQLGKPQGQDLASGNLTAPVLFALESLAHREALLELIEGEFQEDGDLEKALQLVLAAGGIEKARMLARSEADKALQALEGLPETPAKRALQLMVSYVLDRLY